MPFKKRHIEKMVCENPRYIYLRTKYPVHIHDDDELHKLNKPSMTYKEGWQQVAVPCGKCTCCKIEKSNEWATRIANEFEEWDNKGLFLTLSYNNPNLPYNKDGLTTLRRKDIVNFKKRLRKYAEKHLPAIKEWINPQTGKKERPIRTFECGEYGFNGTRAAKGGNPHYHMVVMNWVVNDLVFDKISKKSGLPVYKSETINKIWGKGHCPIGLVTYESASYVARYTMKKNGLAKVEREYYNVEEIDENGEIKIKRKFRNKKGKQESEFISMSTCPGIGKSWFLKNKEKIKEQNCILVKSKRGTITKKIPRYYRKIWEKENWLEYERWRYNYRKYMDNYIKEQIKKYELPEDWILERKINWVNDNKLKSWKVKKDRLTERAVA